MTSEEQSTPPSSDLAALAYHVGVEDTGGQESFAASTDLLLNAAGSSTLRRRPAAAAAAAESSALHEAILEAAVDACRGTSGARSWQARSFCRQLQSASQLVSHESPLPPTMSQP